MLKNKTRGGYPFLASPSKKIASHAKGGNIVDMNAKQRTFSFYCISILVLKSTKCQNNDVAKRLKRQKLQNMDKKYASKYA